MNIEISSASRLVAGAGYRVTDELFRGGPGISLTPVHSKQSLMTAFVQDEIALFGNRLAVTVGSEGQYDSDAGAALQPTVRALLKVLPHQRVWAAASRALRTPSLQDRGIHVAFPPVPTDSGLPLVVMAVGDPAAQDESLSDVEAGYRLDIQGSAWISTTGFVGRYHKLQTREPGAPVVQFVPAPQITVTSQFGNLLTATVSAYTRADLSAEWRFNHRVAAMVTGQNLLDAAHAEFGGPDTLLLATQVPRTLGVRLRWEYK